MKQHVRSGAQPIAFATSSTVLFSSLADTTPYFMKSTQMITPPSLSTAIFMNSGKSKTQCTKQEGCDVFKASIWASLVEHCVVKSGRFVDLNLESLWADLNPQHLLPVQLTSFATLTDFHPLRPSQSHAPVHFLGQRHDGSDDAYAGPPDCCQCCSQS